MAAIFDLARGIVQAAERNVRAFAAQQNLGEFELRVFVVECQRRALESAVCGRGVRPEAGFGNAVAQIARDRRQRLSSDRRKRIVVGIDILQLVCESL